MERKIFNLELLFLIAVFLFFPSCAKKTLIPYKHFTNKDLIKAIESEYKDKTKKIISHWIKGIPDSNLVFTDRQISELYQYPLLFKNKKEYIASKYQSLIQIISNKKQDLKDLFAKYDSTQKENVLILSENVLAAAIEKLLIPAWIGAPWDFDGVPGKTPDLKKPVACGHFVQKILTDAGFNIKKNRSTWLAYVTPEHIVQSIIEKQPIDYKNWSNLVKKMQQDGPGLYILALKGEWEHIVFAHYFDKENVLIMHAGPHPRGASINYDDGRYYLTEYMDWKHIWATKLNNEIVKKWIEGTPIIPFVESDL